MDWPDHSGGASGPTCELVRAKYSQTDKAPTMTEPTRATERAADKAPARAGSTSRCRPAAREPIRQGQFGVGSRAA